ncbi:MAG: PAS domain-containing protein, partial [Giesbergeria sp.]
MKCRYDCPHGYSWFRNVILHFVRGRFSLGVTIPACLMLAQSVMAHAQAAEPEVLVMEIQQQLNLSWVQWGLLALGLFCLVLLFHIVVLRRTVAERTRHLQSSEKKLAAILDNAGALVYIKDLDFRYQYANRQSAQRLGCAPAEVIGKTDADFFGATVAKTLHVSDRQVFEGRERIEVEETATLPGTREKKTFLTAKVPLFGANGEVMALCGYSTDITALRSADEALRLAATVFESPEGMLITSPSRCILQVNRALHRLTGYASGELIGKDLSCLQSGRNDPAFYQDVWRTVAKNDQWAGELWIQRKSGESYPAWVNIAAVRSSAGEITHYVGTQIDISERKEAEEEIRALAYYDTLTGLPNRRLMSDRLQHSLNNS